jgi:hypothetical protein
MSAAVSTVLSFPNRAQLLDAALAWARAGYRVFPCAPDGTLDRLGKPSKAPLTTNGKDDATKDEATITAWWAQWPTANIGGLLPPGVAAIDIDDKPGKHGSEQWVKLPGEKPETITTKSPNGRHLFYAGDVGSTNDERIAPDIDLRGGDGKFYLILAPSVVGGRRYEGPIAPDPATMAPLPAWIAAASPKGAARDRGKGKPPGEPQAAIADIAARLADIPNDDVSWDDCSNVGMAVWRASGATEEGFALYDAWAPSRQSTIQTTCASAGSTGFRARPRMSAIQRCAGAQATPSLRSILVPPRRLRL